MIEPGAAARSTNGGGIEALASFSGERWRADCAAFHPDPQARQAPHETVRVAYALEYGVDEMECTRTPPGPAENVLLLDDLIATGGTATAAAQLLQSAGAVLVSLLCHRPAGLVARLSLRGAAPPCIPCSRSERRDAAAHVRADRGRLARRVVLEQSVPPPQISRSPCDHPGVPATGADATIQRASRSSSGLGSLRASSKTNPRRDTRRPQPWCIRHQRTAELVPDACDASSIWRAYLIAPRGTLAETARTTASRGGRQT